MATATSTTNPNGVDTSTNTSGFTYLGSNGLQYNNYDFEQVDVNGVKLNKKTYSADNSRILQSYD